MSQPAAERRVMEKLLWPAQLQAILERGLSHLGGPVVDAAAVAPLRTPQARLSAYSLEELAPYGRQPDHVDVLRYRAAPLMNHGTPPQEHPHRPWPTYDTGFLRTREAIVPVWLLRTTRIPAGSEIWRIQGNGEQQRLLTYYGPAVGWREARGWTPPPAFLGPRVEWQGQEWIAAFGADDPGWIEVVTYGEAPDPHFVGARPGVVHRMVPAAECRVFELDLRATWRGVPVRVLHRDGEHARAELLDDDPGQAVSLGAESLEPGRFEVDVLLADLVQGESYSYEPGPPGPPAGPA